MTVNRIRHDADAVLDQKEVRLYVWNHESLAWEPYQGNALLTDILSKLEQIRILEGGT